MLQRILTTLLFTGAVITALLLSGCQTASETVTTTTAPDGSVTQTVRRAAVDPFDLAISQNATELMQGGFVP